MTTHLAAGYFPRPPFSFFGSTGSTPYGSSSSVGSAGASPAPAPPSSFFGLAGLKASFDGGTTWSSWSALAFGFSDVDAPDASGLLEARIVVRDKVEYESEVSPPKSVYLIEDELPYLGAGAKFAGGMATALDVDALALDLVTGDVLKAKVKPAKGNKKGKGEWTGTEITFDAVAGSTFKASLQGDGLSTDGVSLVGPQGEVEIETGGRPGKVAIKPVVLDAGTGTYAIRFAAPITVTAKWSLKLPRIKGTVEE